jgi:threonine aldolase
MEARPTVDRIDFRSDTVTWPTREMCAAMADADLGDDVYGEDPTVNELETLAAERVGKEAGLLVPSGTMGNLAAILTHAGRGDEAILGVESHVFRSEAGGMAALGGVTPHTLPTGDDGRMDLNQVEAAVRGDDPHFPRSRLILVENTFSGLGGIPLAPDYFESIRRIADLHRLFVHLDGARLFNAATALRRPAAELTATVDSVTFCLSKGLCAPVGSVLCGDRDFIRRARRVRKSLGGGMRQAGVLAAAGLVSLHSMVDRLVDDHAHARMLAEGLAVLPGIRLDPDRVQTNIVHFELDPDTDLEREELCRRLQDEYGIGLGTYPPNYLRALTHYWVGADEVGTLVDGVRRILESV